MNMNKLLRKLVEGERRHYTDLLLRSFIFKY